MTIEEFFLSKFEGLSVSASLFLLAFAIIRYASAQSKQANDVAHGAMQLAGQTEAGRNRLVEALDKNTIATESSNAIGTKSLAEHEDTQRIVEEVRVKFLDFVADYSQLKATVMVKMEAHKEERKEQRDEESKALAKIGLEMSALQNKLDEIIVGMFPNPRDTKPIPESIHVEARIISEGAPPPVPEINPT